MKLNIKITAPILFVLFIFITQSSFAQAHKDSLINFSSNYYSWVASAAMDANRNITVGGLFQKSAFIQKPTQSMSGNDSFDAFICRIDESGNPIWKNTFGGTGDNEIKDIVIDGAGNSFITGYFNHSFKVDGVQFDSIGFNNGFIARADNSGKIIWAKTFIVSNENYSHSLCCSYTGDLYFNITMNNSIKIGNQIFNNNNIGYSSLLLKIDINGNIIWTRQLLNKNGSIGGLCTDHFGHLYVGGSYFKGKITWGADNIPSKTDTSSRGLFIAKVDETTGNMIWFQQGKSNSYSKISNILMGGDGSLYTAGYFADTLAMQNFKIVTVKHTYTGTPDIIVMNLDTSGNVKWHQFFGSDEPQYVNGFCLDNYDNVYVSGIYDIPITLGAVNLFNTHARDGYIIRFEKEGSYLGSITSVGFTSFSVCGFSTIMIDSRNKLYVTGNINYESQLGDDTITCPGTSVGFIWSVHSSFNGIVPSASDKNENIISMYPNPLNSNILNLKSSIILNGNINLTCLDATGKVILDQNIANTKSINTFSITLPDIKPGLYLIRLKSEEGEYTQKFLRN